MMKIPSTIVVVILATLGVIAMWRSGWGNHAARGNDAQRMAGAKLIAESRLPIDDITRITLKRSDSSALVFERDPAGDLTKWNQTQPFAYPMDPFSIRQLAQVARDLEVMDTIDPAQLTGGLSAQTLALQPPLAEIKYEWSGGELTLDLGRQSVGGRAYVQIKGDPKIYVVNRALHERAIEMDDKEWRSRAIFFGAGVDSQRIEWHNEPAQLVLQRERKQWSMIEPVKTRLDATARDQMLDAVGRAVVGGFILDQPSDADLEKFGLKHSPVSFIVTGADAESGASAANGSAAGAQQKLIIGSRAGGATQDYFGMIEGRPVVVRIGGAVIAQLFRQPQDLAAHTGSGINPADVKSIAIRTSNEELRFDRDLEKWRGRAQNGATPPASSQPQMREVNAALVQNLLEQFTQLRSLSVQIVKQYPRELEVATITLYGYDAKALDTVRIIHDKDSGQWGMENGDNVVRIYPPSLQIKLHAADYGIE